jgi:glycine hydroxymethyltransferase
MRLQAIERIEIIAAELAAEVFGARFAEVRVGSGTLANLYVFMARCQPGDVIIAPPVDIGGHVTHRAAGAAGPYGLRRLAHAVRPKLITLGGSLNLFPHPVAAVRGIADEVGSRLHFDAAHLSGMIASGAWPNPPAEGAHVMTMSTYKSLGGPPGGLVAGQDAALFERIDAIAYPGLHANFGAGKTAALAKGLLDWKVHGGAYALAMQATTRALAEAPTGAGLGGSRDGARRHPGVPAGGGSRALVRRQGGGQAAGRRQAAGLRHRLADRGRGR